MIKVSVTVQSPHDHEQVFTESVLVREDLFDLPPSRKNDAAQSITHQRVGEAFLKAYHAACHPSE